MKPYRVGYFVFVFCSFFLLSGQNLLAAETQATVLPDVLVKDTTNKMLAALTENKEELKQNPDLVYDLVGEIVLPHFDFIRMSRWVLGKNWNHASKPQKLRFIRAFRTLMVRTYAVALLEYTGQEINFLPFRGELNEKGVTINTEVIQPAGKPAIAINYKLYLKKANWKVYDIAVDGISLVSNYRTSFASEVKQDGLDSLISRLEKHNKKAKT